MTSPAALFEHITSLFGNWSNTGCTGALPFLTALLLTIKSLKDAAVRDSHTIRSLIQEHWRQRKGVLIAFKCIRGIDVTANYWTVLLKIQFGSIPFIFTLFPGRGSTIMPRDHVVNLNVYYIRKNPTRSLISLMFTELIYMFVLVLPCFTSLILTNWQPTFHSFAITQNVPLSLTVDSVFQSVVFYWDQRVFSLNSLAKFTTLHKAKSAQRTINEKTTNSGWALAEIKFCITSWQICSDLIKSC